jgi:hypothetical protein
VAKRHQHHHTPMCHFIRENLTIPSIQRADLTLHSLEIDICRLHVGYESVGYKKKL